MNYTSFLNYAFFKIDTRTFSVFRIGFHLLDVGGNGSQRVRGHRDSVGIPDAGFDLKLSQLVSLVRVMYKCSNGVAANLSSSLATFQKSRHIRALAK